MKLTSIPPGSLFLQHKFGSDYIDRLAPLNGMKMTIGIVEQTVQQTMQMLEDGAPHDKILSYLVKTAETIAGHDSVSSILVLDKNGLLRNGSSPGLPYDYLMAMDGLKPDANVGTCAAAAATGSMIITYDFRADDKWAELKHLPLSLGFVGAWSMPIKLEDGRVIGTFGTYFRQKRKPSQEEIEGIQSLSTAAAKVLNWKNKN